MQTKIPDFIDTKEKQLLDIADSSLAAEQRMGTNGEFVRGELKNVKRRRK